VLFAGLAAVSMLAGPKPGALLVPLAMGALAVLVVRRLGYEEFDEVVAMFKKAARFQRQVIANQMRIRRFVADLGQAADAAALFRRLEEFLAETGFSACTVELWLPPPDSPQSHVEHKANQEESGIVQTTEESSLRPLCLCGESSESGPSADTPAPRLAGLSWQWQWTSSNSPDPIDEATCWRIRVPLIDKSGIHRGYVYLARAIEQEKVLFQVSSLLDTFSVHFPARLFRLSSESCREIFENKAGNCFSGSRCEWNQHRS